MPAGVGFYGVGAFQNTTMQKPTHLRVSDTTKISAPKKRSNRRRPNWNRTLKLVSVALALGIAAMLLFWNPALYVTRVRVDGAQTVTAQQVFAEAQVPNHTNIFWMLRQPFARRLAQDPVIDHAARSVHLPNLLVLTVTERQPRVVLAAEGQFWLMDSKGVPYQQVDRPLPPLPIIQVSARVMPDDLILGKPLRAVWLPDAYRLLALLQTTPDLEGAKITVDQNLNLCLNSKHNLQIRLGQSDFLPQKVALADAAVSADGGALAREAAYLDVSSLQQPVYKPRPNLKDTLQDNDRTEPRFD